MLDVVKVMLYTFPYLLEGVGLAAPAIDLGPAGDARLHPMARVVVLDRLLVEQGARLGGERMGPRTDDRHLAAQHVQELRQLVEAGAAQEGADPRDSRVVAT